MNRLEDSFKKIIEALILSPTTAHRQQQAAAATPAQQQQLISLLGVGAFGPQPAPQPREPIEVELDTARIIIVALLGKLGGKVKFKSTDLMIEPGRFAVNKTHGDDGSIVLSLSPVRSDKVVEETK